MGKLHEVVEGRWSPREFTNEHIDSETLTALFEAARWAPSSYNAQPWRFIVATKEDADGFARMLACLNEKNQEWAKSAPVLAISVARRTFEKNNQPNRYAFHDVGLAMGSLLAQATALGVSVHQMGGFNRDKTRTEYGIPEEYDPVAAMAIGYSDEPVPENRARRELGEQVFAGEWGNAAEQVGQEATASG